MVRWIHSLALALLTLAIGSPIVAVETKDADPLRPPAVRTSSVPPVPASLTERLSKYASIRSASLAGWDPEGRGVLVRTRFGNTSQLHRVYQPAGRREQITFLDEPVRGRFVSSADPRILLLFSRGGNENDQVYLLTDGDSRLLTDGESRNRLQAMRHGKSQFVVASNRRNGRDTDLYVVDLARDGQTKMVFEADGEFWYASDWSPDGKTLLLRRYVSINEGYVATVDVATGNKTDISLPGDRVGAVGALAYSKDGQFVYLTTDTHSEFRQLRD